MYNVFTSAVLKYINESHILSYYSYNKCINQADFSRYSLPLHVIDVNVPTSQRVRVLHHGLLHAGHIVGDDFVGVVLDGARRGARACRYRYGINKHI